MTTDPKRWELMTGIKDAPTPETDAAELFGLATHKPISGEGFVPSRLARKLERERDALQQQCDRLTGMKFSDRMHAALISRAEVAERERDEARAELANYKQLARLQRERIEKCESELAQQAAKGCSANCGRGEYLREQLAAANKRAEDAYEVITF